MNCEQAREHLLDRIDGQLEEEVAGALRSHLDRCGECRREAEALSMTWSMMGRLEEEPSSAELRSRFYTMLDSETARARSGPRASRLAAWLLGWWPLRPAAQAALALAMLVLGVWLGPVIRPGAGGGSEIRELRDEMQSMRRAVTLSLLEHQSASERLRAVSFSEGSAPDADLIQALLGVINNDPSVNVRLAALDVLSEMVQRPDVRSGLLESFPHQDSPTMTVAMADVLLDMDGPKSRSEIEEALKNKDLSDPVREYLLEALSEGGKDL